MSHPKRLSAYFATACMIAFSFSTSPAAQDETVSIATLDWPPYTGADLPQGGATTAVVEAAFAKLDKDIKVYFRPWKRAIDMAKKATDDVVAYFPGYHCHHQEGFIASDPIGNGPLGFAENTEAPIDWETLDDIAEQQLKIGTVLGYANTDEFDKRVGTGWILAIPSPDDTTNLKKLARKRIDAVVIDKFVLEYLKATEKSLKNYAGALQFDQRPLEEKTLYLCFRDDEKGRILKNFFNAGLVQVNVDDIADNYFATAFTD